MAMNLRFQYTTGSTIGYSIERLSDGARYDFSTAEFVAAPMMPATPIAPIPELDAPYLGLYSVTLTPTPQAIFTDGDYCLAMHSIPEASVVVAVLGTTMKDGSDGPYYQTLAIPIGPYIANFTIAAATPTQA